MAQPCSPGADWTLGSPSIVLPFLAQQFPQEASPVASPSVLPMKAWEVVVGAVTSRDKGKSLGCERWLEGGEELSWNVVRISSGATWWAGLPLLNVIARLADLGSASLMAQLVKNSPATQETQETRV